MKLLTVIMLFWLPFGGFFNEINTEIVPKEKVKWISMEKALELNKENPKKIIVDFYTDWCGYCKKMDRTTFSNPQIAAYINEHYYAVKFNAESSKSIMYKGQKYKATKSNRPGVFNGTHEFAYEIINNKGRLSYPSIAFFDEESNKITYVPSYLDAKDMDVVLHYFGDDIYKDTSYNIFSGSYKSNIR